MRLPDGEVSAAFEVMRRLLDPDSTALPHVTLRYNSPRLTRSVDDMYFDAAVPEIDLLDVGTFDEFGSTADKVSVLVLRCEVEALEWLHYKPRYGDTTFFHLTLYEGGPSALAAAALQRLSALDWRIRLIGEGRIVAMSPHAARDSAGRPRMSGHARRLHSDLFGRESAAPADLSEAERLRRIVALAEFVHRSRQVRTLESDQSARSGIIAGPRSRPYLQEAFWSEMELPGVRDDDAERRARRATGTVITPPELAIEVARETLKLLPEDLDVRFADPAIGTGMLFAAIRHAAGMSRIARAVGFERDEDRGRATAFRWRRSGLEVFTGDFLSREDGGGEGYNLVLANPPYLRYEMQDREAAALTARRLSRMLGVSVPTRANSFVHFVLASHALMERGAAAGWVLPADFMSATYARGLRQYLGGKVTLTRVHLYDTNEMVFDNARITPAVVVFRNVPPSDRSVVRFTYGGTPEAPGRTVLVPASELAKGDSWGLITAAPSSVREAYATVGDYFIVRRGLATGGNSFFVLSDERRQLLEAPDSWLRPVLPKSRFVPGSVIRADESGVPVGVPLQWLIDSEDTIASARRASPKFARYLQDVPDEVRMGTIVSRRRSIFKQAGAFPAPFVCIAMARLSSAVRDGEDNRRFLWNASSAIALNNYHTLTPRAGLAEDLASGRTGFWDVLAALRRIPEVELARVGRLHSAGLLKLEPADVRALPITLELSES